MNASRQSQRLRKLTQNTATDTSERPEKQECEIAGPLEQQRSQPPSAAKEEEDDTDDEYDESEDEDDESVRRKHSTLDVSKLKEQLKEQGNSFARFCLSVVKRSKNPSKMQMM